MPENPIIGTSVMINEMGVAVQVIEWASVVLAAAILATDLKEKQVSKKTVSDTS